MTGHRAPWALVLAAVAAALLETLLISQAWLLADTSNLALIHQKKLLQERRFGEDVIIFGDSLLMSLDPAVMRRQTGGAYTIRNVSVRDLGVSASYVRSLEQYLDHQAPPKLILFSVRWDYFYSTKEPLDDRLIQRLRRYWDVRVPMRIWRTPAEKIRILRGYARNLLPSWNYRVFLLAALPEPLARFGNLQSDVLQKIAPAPAARTLERNRKILGRMENLEGYFDVIYGDKACDPAILRRESRMPSIPPDTVYPGTRNLEAFVALAGERGIPVVFLLTPLNPHHWKRSPGFFRNFEKRLGEFEKKYSSFTYLRVEDLSYEERFFADVAHLNGPGSASFSADAARLLDPVIRKKLKGESVQGLAPAKGWK